MATPTTRKFLDWDGLVTRTESADVENSFDRLYLVVFQKHSSSMFPIPPSGQVLIGRADNADLVLQESGVSRRHARLEVTRGEVRVIDLASQNGTYVNGQKIVDASG